MGHLKNHEDETAARNIFSRRSFLQVAGLATLGNAALPLIARGAEPGSELLTTFEQEPSSSRRAPTNNRYFYFAVIADTHIIDDFYKGPEGNALDTETIFQTTKRLEAARTVINNLKPPIERVFLVGDYFHDYPSIEHNFYFKNQTRIDRAKALTDNFKMPVHVGFGNHDYAVPKVSREMSHELFREKLNLKPYYSVEHKGYKFIHLNNFLGETWNPASKDYNRGTGSLGLEQLTWFEAELRERRPAFVFIHYPLVNVRDREHLDMGAHTLIKKYKDTIQLVVAGHWHKWIDLARTFGPQHYVMGSTRYDQDAYMIVQVDARKGTHQILNLNLVDWSTHYSQPYMRN